MAESSFTLLEVHLGDGNVEIGPFKLFGASEEPAAGIESNSDANADRASDDAESDGGCRGKSIAGLLLALAALVAVAVAVVTLRGDDDVPSGIAGDD
jgi:hypothetical protein